MDIFYVGIDWGSEKHAVCVVTEEGGVRAERMLKNDGAFVRKLVELVGGEEQARSASFAIESRDLPIVDMLVEAGCAVFTLNPKQAERFRDRLSPGGAKDDRRDARVLAGALRTDRDAFRRVEVESPAQALLRLRARAVVDAEAQLRMSANQLTAVLARYFPAVLELCPGADERWLWALLRHAGTPDKAARIRSTTLEAILASCRVRRIDAAHLQALLRAPHLRASAGVQKACAEEVASLVQLLELLHAQRKRVTTLRDEAVEQLRAEQLRVEQPGYASTTDIDLVGSMPGAGPLVIATLFGEAELALRERNLVALRAMAGVAPVTKRSGKSKSVSMRRARNVHLTNALFHAARIASVIDARFKALFTAIRARGKSYGRALRGVADRYLDVMFAVLRERTPYDAARAARSLAATG